MDSDLRALALGAVLQYTPPFLQKEIIEQIMKECNIKLGGETLEQYEKYWQRVNEHFTQDYMAKH